VGNVKIGNRRRMLDLPVGANRSVDAIAGQFQMSRPSVCRRLRIRRDADLVTARRRGRQRRDRLVPWQLRRVRAWRACWAPFGENRLERFGKHHAKRNE
jgi:DNA-binding transcriptional ArsR family regulator